MALLFLDLSICGICGHVLRREEELVAFPPFEGNEQDPMYFFSDAGFHAACFLTHPLKDEAVRARAAYHARPKPSRP
jgi:hypothetical protein